MSGQETVVLYLDPTSSVTILSMPKTDKNLSFLLLMCNHSGETDSPSLLLGAGNAGPGAPRATLRKGSRLTYGGRFGFKGWGPSGGRGFLSGVTSPVLLCLACCRNGTGVEAWACAGDAGGGGLKAAGFWCLIIMFCSISPVCLTLFESGDCMDALMPEFGGSRGKEPGLEGMEAAIIGSALGSLTRPGPDNWEGNGVGSFCWARLFSSAGRIALPNPGRGDFGEPLSRLLVSEVLGLLLNLALRALTSTLSSWQQHRIRNSNWSCCT